MLVLVAGAAAWGAVRGAAELLAYFERGADPASALNIIPNVPPDLHVKLSWRADDAATGRAIEPVTRTQIEASYIRAWLQWGLSYTKGQPYGLKTYFEGPALEAVSNAVNDAAAQGLTIEQTDTAHNLQLHFYSANGAIVSFTDHDALVAQVIRDSSGAIVYAGETRANYDVVMFLQDGDWHVRHWVRRAAADAPPAAGSSGRSGFVTRSGTRLMLDGEPFQVYGINYYPRVTPWDRFWINYDPAEIDRDLTAIRSLGLNTVRTFIPFEQFGGPKPDPVMLDRLQDFLDRVDANGMKALPTLFDFRTDYRPLLWPESDRHLERILTRFRDHRAILAWDMKNEPNNDYSSNGAEVVDAWLAHTARLAHQYDPNHLVTIGWLNPRAASNLADEVDFISYHFFSPAEELPAGYAALRAAVPDKPILMSEFGLPTWNSWIFPHGHTEAEQASYYADILRTMRTTDSVGTAVWTLHDFSYVPKQVTGGQPWRIGPELQLGVLRADGTPKPAAALLAPGASLDVPPVPGWARWIKPFWLTMYGLALLLPVLAVWRWCKRQRPQRSSKAPPMLGALTKKNASITPPGMFNMALLGPSITRLLQEAATVEQSPPAIAQASVDLPAELAGAAEPTVPFDLSDTEILVRPGDIFQGNYRSERSVRVQGTACGSIESGQYILIEAGAHVEADIAAAEIIIAGSFSGRLICLGRLEIMETGSVHGVIETYSLLLHEGGSATGDLRVWYNET